jgi:hypothetical protein
MEALMVAVADHVGKTILADFRRQFDAERSEKEPPLELALRLVRAHAHSRKNRAWFELANAARTNEALKTSLSPIARRYYDAITDTAREVVPDLAADLGPAFPVVVDTILCLFDGEVMHGFIEREAEIEEQRLALLPVLLAPLLTTSRRGRRR